MLWFMLACGSKSPETPVESTVSAPEVQKVLVEKSQPAVMLDGVRIEVTWDDGDTFHGKRADGSKIKARLNGYNTLESYGPVHQWGEWTEQELYAFAKESGVFASGTVWECTDTQKGGGYGRALVDCPDLRRELLERGFAHPFSIGSTAPEADLQALQKGIANKAGMWAKGTPSSIITSLHSNDEKADQDAYNRVCSLETGECTQMTHTDVYATCQKVCVEELGSCMTYVPYKSRYGDAKADCLR